MPEPKTLKQLRDLAELNLCDRCKPVYSSLIEPNIKSIIDGYFHYWKDMEWRVTVMVMKLENVFKTSRVYLNLEPSDAKRFSDEVDYELWKKINKWKLERKLDYLHKNKILGTSSYKLLETLRKKRNKKIHQPYNDFVEQDLTEFMYGAHVVQNIWLTMTAGFEPHIVENIQKGAENLAEIYYDLIIKTV